MSRVTLGRAGILILLAILSAAGGFALTRSQSAHAPRLTFLAVGQGDCAVWEDAGAVVLVDVGPKTKFGFDAGERIVLPKLRWMGIQHVSLILITHPDADHIGGLVAVRERFPEARIVASSLFKESPEMLKWLKWSKVDPKDVIWIEDQSRVRLERSTLDVAAPVPSRGAGQNDASLFVRIQCGAGSAVLTGDASISVEEDMQPKLEWKAQVLKAGHHGSRTATGSAFVRAISPKWAVISCGLDNSFGHPHRSVLQTLERHKVVPFRTDLQGDVVFEVSVGGFSPVQVSR